MTVFPPCFEYVPYVWYKLYGPWTPQPWGCALAPDTHTRLLWQVTDGLHCKSSSTTAQASGVNLPPTMLQITTAIFPMYKAQQTQSLNIICGINISSFILLYSSIPVCVMSNSKHSPKKRVVRIKVCESKPQVSQNISTIPSSWSKGVVEQVV